MAMAMAMRLARQLLFGLIVGIFVCNPQETLAQAIRYVPRHGSVSKANSNAYDRTVDFGPLEFNQGVSNSRSVTKANGGLRNGGTTSIANSNAINRGVNIGGVDIGSTFTRTQTNNNGAVSRGVAQDFNVGNFGIGSSISPDNLRNGFGLQRSPNGGLSFGLGLLNVGLTNNAQQHNPALTNAQVDASGKNARVRSGGNTYSDQQQYGLFGVKETVSNSNAAGRTKFGQTSALASGQTNGAATNAGTSYYRLRRARLNGQFSKYRPKRHAQFVPFAYPEESFIRAKRQFNWGRPNRRGQFQQQAGANTHSNNEYNQGGFFQDNGASSIGSNVANDGSSGQVSSSNVAQMNKETADGLSNTNNAQSQSLNFDPNQQQASNANAGTEHLQNANFESIKANSGSQASNNNEYGTSSNIANTNSGVVREGGRETVSSDASSQSIYQGANGGNSGAFTNSKTMSSNGPGFQSNSASSSASATSNGAGPANADASANAGNFNGGGGGGFGGGYGGFGGGGRGNRRKVAYQSRPLTSHQREQQRQQSRPRQLPIYVSTASSSILINCQNGSTARRQQLPLPQQTALELIDLRRPSNVKAHSSLVNGVVAINRTTEQFGAIDENAPQGRTFGFITDFINSLSQCVIPCTMDAFYNNRCCEQLPPPFLPPVIPPLPLPQPIPGPFLPPRTPPCCISPAIFPRPFLPPLLPPAPPPQLMSLPRPLPPSIPFPRPVPFNCCLTCVGNGLFGPPPCYGFGYGGATAIANAVIGNGPLLGGLSNNAVGWGRAAAPIRSSSDSTEAQVTVYVPRPSSLTSLCASTRDM